MGYSHHELVGELSSTLGASSLENFSTVSRSHSFSEAVFLHSLSFLRLIRSFHDSTSFSVLTSSWHEAKKTVRKQNTLYLKMRDLSIPFENILINFYIISLNTS